MQIETCRVGDSLRLDERTRIVIHRLDGQRVCLSATAPAGTILIFGGEPLRPLSGTACTSHFFISLQAIRRFVLGRYAVEVWWPGAIVPQAADFDDRLHIGFTVLPLPPMPEGQPQSPETDPLLATVVTARPLLQAPGGGGRPLYAEA
jgi:hypothetical protein